MSKKRDFKGLLDDNAGTGTDQKLRILGTHLIPEDSKSDNPITTNESLGTVIENPINDSNQQTSNVEQNGGFPSEKTEIVSDGKPSEPVDHSIKQLQSAEPHDSITNRKDTSSSNKAITRTDHKTDQQGISTLVSNLKNLDELNVEDTHTRKTYLIDNQLLDELNKVSAGKKKGYKTKIINTGLRIVLELMRNDSNFKV